MVSHASAFHPYTRPTVTNPMPQQELSLSEEHLRFLMSADTLVALSQLPGSAKLFQPKPASSPLPALTPNPSNSPASSIAEQPIQSPNLPNERTRRKRTTFSPEQAAKLETEYLSDSYMAREKRLLLAHSLSLSENQVKTWFQNRRAKDKRDRKTENSSNTTHSRKSSPSRKSSSESSPTPSVMPITTTPFVLPPAHHIQTASSPVTIDQLSSTPPAATTIQKVDQFPSPLPQLLPNLDLLNTYLQTLANPNVLQSLLGSSSSPPMFDPSVLINFQSPLESALI